MPKKKPRWGGFTLERSDSQGIRALTITTKIILENLILLHLP